MLPPFIKNSVCTRDISLWYTAFEAMFRILLATPAPGPVIYNFSKLAFLTLVFAAGGRPMRVGRYLCDGAHDGARLAHAAPGHKRRRGGR